ncbi:14-3-3-like protein D [Tanacetum coccineum]
MKCWKVFWRPRLKGRQRGDQATCKLLGCLLGDVIEVLGCLLEHSWGEDERLGDDGEDGEKDGSATVIRRWTMEKMEYGEDGREGANETTQSFSLARNCLFSFWTRFSLVHEDNIEFKEFDLRDKVAQFCVLKLASTTTEADLSPTHHIRLCLTLNFFVFYYKNMNPPERCTSGMFERSKA